MKAALVADYVAMARMAMCDPDCTCDHSIIRAVADERDAALSALRDEEKKTYAAMRETHDARLQRDRALALLQSEKAGTSCGYPGSPVAECGGDWSGEGESKVGDLCWWHRVGALQAEVDG